MKANLSAFASLFLGASLGFIPPAFGADRVILDEEIEPIDSTRCESSYAPLSGAFHWGREAGSREDWFAIEAPPVVHPSLAADLMEGADELPSEDLLAVEAQYPVAEETASVEERVMAPSVHDVDGTRDRKLIQGVSGIPHPAAAGLAALVGLVLIVGRKERIA